MDSKIRTVNSGAGAGDQTSRLSFGTGRFKILSLTVFPGLTTDFAQLVRILLKVQIGDQTYQDIYMGAGEFTPLKPYVLNNVEFDGPALIDSMVFHLGTTSHNMTIHYRRLDH